MDAILSVLRSAIVRHLTVSIWSRRPLAFWFIPRDGKEVCKMMLKVPRDDNNPKASEMKKVSEICYRFYDRRHEMMLLNEAYPHVAFACLIDRYKGSEKQFDPKVHRGKLHDLGTSRQNFDGALCDIDECWPD